ncbi:MAG TPA: DUF3105 domain-containing protein, partial [Polyangiaceae bacterium]|nr:DUF3105 domain-containing protein [Polyangiaceae bacterium]
MRRALSLALLSVLSGLGACSGSDHPSNTPSGGTAGSAASSNTAGRGGEAAAPSAGSGGGGTDASAGSDDEGGSTAGTFTDAGAAGTTPGGSGGMTGEGGSPELGSSGAAGVCSAVSASYELSAGVHVAACTPIDYSTNPPSSGEHYPSWADFGAYDFPLPRGYWVHNLEHGAVVVSYNCPDGCDDDVERAKAWLAQLTADATCSTGPARVLLV